MFFVQVHSVDTDQPLTVGIWPEQSSTTSTVSQRNSTASYVHTKFSERRGIIHLFRSISHSSLPNPSSQSTILFVVAVPNYLSYDDFINFCGSRINHVSELLFIRNDGMEERYSVLIKLGNQMDADGFFGRLNGKKFSPSEAEVCHILFLMSVEYTESAEVAGSPPDGCTELPTCPVCLERFDPDTSGIIHTLCDHSFHCPCISKWTSLSCQVCRFCQQQDEKQACFICGTTENLWVCVICGFLGCGRYKEGHAIRHWKNMHHCYSLDLRTQQIWDYVGDTYVHRLNQSKVDGKFGEMNSHCISHEGECGTCEYDEDSGINEALYSSKVEAIVDEYNRLLATQLETQRQYYESLLAEAKSKREVSVSEAVEEALISKTQDIHDKLENCVKEKNVVSDVNQKLIKNQEMWMAKAKQIEERELASLKWRNEKIHDLEEQIRDLTVYIEAQKTLNKITGSDDIKGGTVLPVPAKESSPSSGRKKKGSRRRN
ncbi:BRCA1-associated protein [Cucurbita moschata]|uniref:BRCA1-associated protein n=1 Tax=Cucurbita moschata TaxID=3662 RepID=A0A6J1G3B0_CUCMO|nr:BRCA1-associated protein [Cucurbita moschata]XP_022946245.1 BRCA1-associated protein [Cucurbita moschata]